MFSRLITWFHSLFDCPKTPTEEPVLFPDVDDEVVVPTTPNDVPEVNQTFVDISHHKTIDFSKFQFEDCIFKVTEHVSHIDSKFKTYLQECKSRGIRYGVYHYYRVQYDPIQQAKHFIKTIGLENLKSCYHLPVVDYEVIGQGKSPEKALYNDLADLKKFIEYVSEQTGRECRIYSNDSMMRYLAAGFERHGIHEITDLPWIARYHSKSNTPQYFSPWSGYWAHQYTDLGKMDGSSDNIDFNYFVNP